MFVSYNPRKGADDGAPDASGVDDAAAAADVGVTRVTPSSVIDNPGGTSAV